jgi:hypothetical protein
MDQAAVFLASSILIGLSAILIFAVILIINNLLHRHWKPFNLYRIVDPNMRFAEPHELEKIDKDKK